MNVRDLYIKAYQHFGYAAILANESVQIGDIVPFYSNSLFASTLILSRTRVNREITLDEYIAFTCMVNPNYTEADVRASTLERMQSAKCYAVIAD